MNRRPTQNLLHVVVLFALLLSTFAGAFVAAGVFAPQVALAQDPTYVWTAYNDLNWSAGQPNTNVTTFFPSGTGTSTSGTLVRRADGASTGVTVNVTRSSGTQVTQAAGGSMPNTGTDAYTTFNGNVSIIGQIAYASSGSRSVTFAFTGLDQNKRYAFASTGNQNNGSGTRNVSFAISDLSSSTSAHSSGVSGTTTATINTYNNTANGHVARWINISPGSDGDFTVTVSISSQSSTYYGPAVFMLAEQAPLSLTYTAGTGGSITGSTSQSVPYGNNGTLVTAVAAANYHFVNWTPGGSTVAARTDTNVTANASYTANFALNDYTLTYTAGANGTISGTSPQTVQHGSSGTIVTAVPNPGYVFTGWTPTGGTNPVRTDSIVTANATYTANFALAPTTVCFDTRVGTGNDDAIEAASTGQTPNLTSSLTFYAGSAQQRWGLRFQDANTSLIPQGATVYEASLRFRATVSDNDGSPQMTFRGELAASPGSFAAAAGNIANRGLTVASAQWPSGAWTNGTDYTTSASISPAFADVIEEIVGLSTWGTSSKSLVIIGEASGASSTNQRTAASYNTSASTAPLLHVCYGPPSGSTTPTIPPTEWVAYNDVVWQTAPSGNITAYTLPSVSGGSTSGVLKDFTTGLAVPAQVVISTSSTDVVRSGAGNGGTNPLTGTDAQATFSGKVDMTDATVYADSLGWWVDVTISGLDPAKKYTFATSANRYTPGDTGNYSGAGARLSRFTISGHQAATNASSNGVIAVNNNSVAFNTGRNLEAGYIARWVSIQPSAAGTFKVRVEHHSATTYQAYGPSVFMLALEGDPPPPVTLTVTADAARGSVTLSPTPGVGSTYPSGQTVTLTPQPLANFLFSGWSGTNGAEVQGSGPSYTLAMNANKAVQANFVAAQCFNNVELVATDDTYISSSSASSEVNNYGGVNQVRISSGPVVSGSNGERGGLLRWNVDALPDNAVIQSASMRLYIEEIDLQSSTASYDLYRLTRDWIEGIGGVTTQNGENTAAADASWLTSGVSTWAGVGATGVPTDRSSDNLWTYPAGFLSTLPLNSAKTLVLNDLGEAVVQGWISGALPNYGFTIQNYVGDNSVVHFTSTEGTTAANRPRLIVNYCVPIGPSISVTGSLLPFGTLTNVPSAEQSYTVSGSNLESDIVVTAPAGFEVRTSAGSFGPSVTLPRVSGSVASTTIFVRLNSATAGTPSGSITHTSTNAGTQNQAVSGTVSTHAPAIAHIGPLDNALNEALPPTLSATVTDLDTAASSLNVTIYGRAVGAEVPAGAPFTIVAIPDTQNAAENQPTSMLNQFQWIADQWVAGSGATIAKDIKFVTNLGDIVNTANTTQYTNADAAYDRFDLAIPRVPYSISPGNHDIVPTGGNSVIFNNWFGPARFQGNGYYQGPRETGKNEDNYSFFSAGGMDFIVINLTFAAPTASIDWADSLLVANPTRRGIVVQHDCLQPNNSWDNQATYNGLRDRPNFFLLLCGHNHTTTDGSAYVAGSGTDAHPIHVLMTDYQQLPNQDNGYMRLLRFVPAEDKIEASVYSPFLGYRTLDTTEDFDMTYDMPGVAEAPWQVICNSVTDAIPDCVRAGDTFSTSWTGLADATEYEWYVVASDGVNTASTQSIPWSFTTEAAPVNRALTVIANPVAGGVTNPVAGSHSYADGTGVPVTATADDDAGYMFDHWSGDCLGTGACSVTMNGDKSVTANFVLKTYQVTPSVNGAGGSINPNTAQTVSHGGSASFTVTPESNFEIDQVLDGATPLTPVAGQYVVSNVTSARTIVASFKPVLHSFTLNADLAHGSVAVSEDLSNYIPVCDDGQCTLFYAHYTQLFVSATPASNYIPSWSGACDDFSGELCTVILNSDKTVLLSFLPIMHQMTMAVDPAGSGTTSPALGTAHSVNQGVAVEISAEAAPGFHFTSWTATSGAVLDNDCDELDECAVTLTDDATVTAHFAETAVVSVEAQTVTPVRVGGWPNKFPVTLRIDASDFDDLNSVDAVVRVSSCLVLEPGTLVWDGDLPASYAFGPSLFDDPDDAFTDLHLALSSAVGDPSSWTSISDSTLTFYLQGDSDEDCDGVVGATDSRTFVIDVLDYTDSAPVPDAAHCTQGTSLLESTCLGDGATYSVLYNSLPSSVSVSPDSFDENSNDYAGTLSGTDVDAGDAAALTFALCTSGALYDDSDTDSFSLSGNQLSLADGASFNHEASSTATVCVVASDGFGSSSRLLTLGVTDMNEAPVLGAIGPKSVDEGEPLAFTATATDADLPANTLTFSLGAGAPAGASIDPVSGVFSWTPSEAQGPGTYPITVVVSDGTATDDESFTVTVDEANIAPVLEEIADKTVEEGVELTFIALATDDDLPANTLVYSLDNAPVGATIDSASGEFTWTPSEEQGGAVYDITVQVSDEAADVSWNFMITVLETNSAPELNALADATVDEGVELSFTAVATDPDLPVNILTFSLVGEDYGATITGGTFSWTPAPSQGPGEYEFTVRVTDDGLPTPLSNDKSFTVTVLDSTPPVITLNGNADVTIDVGSPFVDPGATALDNVDGSVAVIVGGDVVDVNTEGTYVITYDAEDISGNHALQVIRTVHVVAVATYPLTVHFDGTGSGAVSSVPAGIDCDDGDALCVANFAAGAVELTAAPSEGSHFTGWTGCNSTSGDDGEFCQITMASPGREVTAGFALNQYTIDASADTGGSITPDGIVPVSHGADQAFAIVANAGYHIVDVLVDDVSVGAAASYTFMNVTNGHTIAASFALTPPETTLQLSNISGNLGSMQTMQVLLNNVDRMTGAAIRVNFDPNVVEFVAARAGSLIAGKGTFLPLPPSSLGAGNLGLGYVFSGGPGTQPTGSGVYAEVDFILTGTPGVASSVAFNQRDLTSVPTGAATFTPEVLVGGAISIAEAVYDIDGTVKYWSGVDVPVPGVTLALDGFSNDASTTSASDGVYAFNDVLGGAYTITPALSGNSCLPTWTLQCMLGSNDALLVLRHTFGAPALTGNVLLVADAYPGGGVNTADASAILQAAVGNAADGSPGDWVFIPTTSSFTLDADRNEIFLGAVLGDVDGSWAVPENLVAAEALAAAAEGAKIILRPGAFEENGTQTVEVLVDAGGGNAGQSVDLTLSFDGAAVTALPPVGADGWLLASNESLAGVQRIALATAQPGDASVPVLRLRFAPDGVNETASIVVTSARVNGRVVPVVSYGHSYRVLLPMLQK